MTDSRWIYYTDFISVGLYIGLLQCENTIVHDGKFLEIKSFHTSYGGASFQYYQYCKSNPDSLFNTGFLTLILIGNAHGNLSSPWIRYVICDVKGNENGMLFPENLMAYLKHDLILTSLLKVSEIQL